MTGPKKPWATYLQAQLQGQLFGSFQYATNDISPDRKKNK